MPSNYDQIRRENLEEYGKGTRHLAFLGNLYTDRTHFIFELLQNAEDAGASRILFRLLSDRLEVTHDGRPFDERDVRGICGVGEGTKAEDLTQIGKFGIGFKSVYAYTATPEIHSGDEHFRIEHYVRPYPADPRHMDDTWTTLFAFPFDVDTITPELSCREIAERLRNLSARTLLFLRRIKEIEYTLPDGTSGIYLREERHQEYGKCVTVIGQNNGEEEDENWLVFDRQVSVPGSDSSVRVEVAFKLNAGVEDKAENIIRVKDAPLVVYFPTEKSTRLGFLIQGPYRTTPSRDNVPKDDPWNEVLVEETAALLVEALLMIREMGLLTVSLLETLPIRADDFPEGSMFFPIARRVRDAFMHERLLPADDGTFIAAKDSLLARGADLRKLLAKEQLCSLFQGASQPKWLVGTITQDVNPDLRAYLLNQLEVQEVTPDIFARRVSASFLQEQSDDWMVLFYSYLATQKALWKKGPGSWNPPLRMRPIIRIQDGSHVTPFRDDDFPNAYLSDESPAGASLPLVRVELSRHPDSRQFLTELGIPEFDLVAEVIENVLPKYSGDSTDVTDDEHKRDIDTVERAYATDSHEKRARLEEQLRATPFIRAERQDEASVAYGSPSALYFSSDELRLYFSGNRTVGFVDSEYSESAKTLFKELGVSSSVRIRRKEATGRGFVRIRDWHGSHQRGLNGFDPGIRVDGLEHALASPTVEKSRFIWNCIALPHLACLRGTVEYSTRQTYENSTKKDRISEFGRLLIETDWLPGPDGNLRVPCELTVDDLPDSFIRDEKLAQQLGMKMNVVAELAKEAGVTAEDVELLRLYPEEFQQWKETISARKRTPTFPERTSSKPERREAKLNQRALSAPTKEYEGRNRSVRTTREAVDPGPWLRDRYTNDAGQMVCQICQEEMPFRKRDGNHYFEAVEVFADIEYEFGELYLALCPVCAAKYKEYVKRNDDTMQDFRRSLLSVNALEVPVNLGSEVMESVRFVETHKEDIRTILQSLEESELHEG